MKKYLFIAAVAALALVSCEQEKDINVNKVPAGENNVSFVLQSGAPTRSGEVVSPVRKGFSVELGQVDDQTIFLEETITDLGYSEPETKGTPLYTENLGYLYRDKLGVHTSTYTAGDVVYQQISEDNLTDGKFWCYGYDYPTNLWGNQTTDKVDFAFYMPANMTSSGVSPTFTGNATTFTYVSPTTAVETQDIVFGGVTKTFKEYLSDYAKFGGTKVKLYHALTGVKFAIANAKKNGKLEYDIQIKEIIFTGLANKGTCTFTPGTTGLDGGDITWDARTVKADPEDNVISQTFGASDLVDYNKDTDGNHFAESYFDGGTSQNINDAKASKTFWLIPQVIDADSPATLTIKFTMNGKNQEVTIDMSDLHTSNWQPAQIRTYTFKIDEVNLKIEDKVTLAGGAANGFTGSKKDQVTITNTGNCEAFIRASIVGQWLRDIYAIDPTTGEETTQLIESYPVFGFTDNVNNLYEVASWYQDQFVTLEGASIPTRNQGHFVELSGYDKANGFNDWVLCDDNYYYYTVPVDPEAQDDNGSSKTKALFKEYIVGTAPMSTIAGLQISNKNMHFTLEIATQAIAANKINGLPEDWDVAWEKATGKKPVKKTN